MSIGKLRQREWHGIKWMTGVEDQSMPLYISHGLKLMSWILIGRLSKVYIYIVLFLSVIPSLDHPGTVPRWDEESSLHQEGNRGWFSKTGTVWEGHFYLYSVRESEWVALIVKSHTVTQSRSLRRLDNPCDKPISKHLLSLSLWWQPEHSCRVCVFLPVHARVSPHPMVDARPWTVWRCVPLHMENVLLWTIVKYSPCGHHAGNRLCP